VKAVACRYSITDEFDRSLKLNMCDWKIIIIATCDSSKDNMHDIIGMNSRYDILTRMVKYIGAAQNRDKQ
jgi:hypothetical protein